MEIREMITEIKGRLDTRGGLKAVIFVACGGSQPSILASIFWSVRPMK